MVGALGDQGSREVSVMSVWSFMAGMGVGLCTVAAGWFGGIGWILWDRRDMGRRIPEGRRPKVLAGMPVPLDDWRA
jgi:hypothetical protein